MVMRHMFYAFRATVAYVCECPCQLEPDGAPAPEQRTVDTQMELLPAAPPAYAMFRPGPLAFAHDRQSRAVDNEMQALARWDSSTREVEVLATP